MLRVIPPRFGDADDRVSAEKRMSLTSTSHRRDCALTLVQGHPIQMLRSCPTSRESYSKALPSLLGAALKAKRRVCQSRLVVNRVVP
jgi:hypothetical protein